MMVDEEEEDEEFDDNGVPKLRRAEEGGSMGMGQIDGPKCGTSKCNGTAKKAASAPPPSAAQMNMRGVFLHVLADALGSVVVIISALIMWLTDWEYKFYVDPGKMKFKIAIIFSQLIREADPQLWMVVITIFACGVRPSVPTFKISQNKKLSSENSDCYWWDCGSGRVDH